MPIYKFQDEVITRMHSSRMRSVRYSGHLGGGVLARGGLPRGCLPRGVCVCPGVSAWVGVCLRTVKMTILSLCLVRYLFSVVHGNIDLPNQS